MLGYDEEGNAIYGVAVGESDNESGKYKKYAWFTAGKLSFFNENEYEVAYVSQNKLYITDAQFLGDVIVKNYKFAGFFYSEIFILSRKFLESFFPRRKNLRSGYQRTGTPFSMVRSP